MHAIAQSLGMSEVIIHRYCRILSAYGMGLADVVEEVQEPYSSAYNSESVIGASRRELNLRLQVRGIGVTNILRPQELEPTSETPVPEGEYKIYFTTGWQDTPLFKLEKLGYGHILHGPAIIMNGNSTVIVEPKCKGSNNQVWKYKIEIDSVTNVVKSKTKLRMCPDGGLVANAPHVPVHLGAMSTSRGHHAEIGGITPGSMPPTSKAIWKKELQSKHSRWLIEGVFQEEGIIKLLQSPSSGENSGHKVPGTRRLQDNLSDLRAQRNAEEAVREMLKSVAAKSGAQSFSVIEEEDFMDDGSVIHLKLSIDAKTGEATFDFREPVLKFMATGMPHER
ncbi:hypothetical protein HPP92_019340 [Vanilla planifolia]|uniref:Uncharacterized protein n=1 Tax=Vanilla planifolia TaxID=51239 RepID=A0A835UMT7_VANPL|nr:hypothetical protein HPP92_019340 [Vanilla planifolia]